MPVKRACDVCFRRKIQCIKPDPNVPCEWCSDHNLECAVTRESQRKRPDDVSTLLGHVQSLTRRVTELEKTVEYLRSSIGASPALINHITPLSSATTATAHINSPSVTPLAYQSTRKVQNQVCFGKHWYFKGIPIFAEKGVDWMASKIGERPELNFRLFGTQSSSESLPHPRLALPERQVVEELLSSFLHSQWQSMYPVIDPTAIEEVINAAYSPQTVYGQGTSEAFILAAVAMCSKFQNAEASTLLDGSIYADKAQSYLIQNPQESTTEILEMSIMLVSLPDPVSPTAIDSLAHLQKPIRAVGRCSDTSLYRLSHDLRLERSLFLPRPALPQTNSQSLLVMLHPRQRHFHSLWTTISSDSGLLRLDFTTRLTCDIHPSARPLRHPIPPRFTTQSSQREHLPFLCSLANPNLQDGTILCHVRQLDVDLERWRQSIPLAFRPKLSQSPDKPQMSSLHKRRRIHLQLEYNYLTTIIHTAIRRCGAAYAADETMPDDLHSVYHSSSDLTLEASRTTLRILKEENFLEQDVFGHLAYYIPLAALALFINILIHPREKVAQADLDILASSITLFKDLRLTDSDVDSVKELSRFIAELVRLGNGAIKKAKQHNR